MTSKVVIQVSGGVISNIHSEDGDLDIDIIDWDDIEEDVEDTEIRVAALIEDMVEVY